MCPLLSVYTHRYYIHTYIRIICGALYLHTYVRVYVCTALLFFKGTMSLSLEGSIVVVCTYIHAYICTYICMGVCTYVCTVYTVHLQ